MLPSRRTVATIGLAYDWPPPGLTGPGWSAQLAPPSGDSAVLISRCGSLESVVRKPPQNARRPPGSTTSAGFVKPVQPLCTGVVAPIRPSREIAVCSRSSVFGPVGWCHARCSTPSPVRARPTWSMPDPSSVVTRFHGAADAVGAAASAASMAVRTAARSFIARRYRAPANRQSALRGARSGRAPRRVAQLARYSSQASRMRCTWPAVNSV